MTRVWRIVDDDGAQHGHLWDRPPDRLAILLVRSLGQGVHVEVADRGPWHPTGLDL